MGVNVTGGVWFSGKRKDLLNFIENGMEGKLIDKDEVDDGLELYIGTDESLIDSLSWENPINLSFDFWNRLDESEDYQCEMQTSFEVPFEVKAEDFLKICTKYNLNCFVYGIEVVNEIIRIVEIKDGMVAQNVSKNIWRSIKSKAA